MRHDDTLDKVLSVYLGGLCRSPFRYKGRVFRPKPVHVSPLLLRGFTCPSRCGACCGSFSLDFLPTEQATVRAQLRYVPVNDRDVPVFSDKQADVADRWCRYLDRATGRCGVYDQRPMACDFELIRLLIYDDRVHLTQKLYGRAWAMMRIDLDRGTRCEMTPPNAHTLKEVERKLSRLLGWAEHFGVETCLPQILSWVKSKHHENGLVLPV